jgi:glycosyltransferase involved in cell wall biosynthesis
MKALPKICFVAPNAYPILAKDTNLKRVGGAELQQCIIAGALRRRGYSVSMICLDFGQPDNLNIDGIRVFKAHKPYAGIPVLRFFHPRISSFWQAMKKADADIYYQRCASILTSVVSFFCQQAGKKMIFSIASDSDLIPGKQLIRYKRDKLIYEWGLKHSDVIIAQTHQQQKLCKRNYNRDSVCIQSCYELSSCNIGNGKKIDVLWVRTIKSIKRPEHFIELARRMPELRFRMVGGPHNADEFESYYCNIKEQAAKVPNLEFIGFVPYAEIDKHFNETYLFVNTSDVEGFPNTFLQSWLREIPTVSFWDMNKIFEGQKVGFVVSSVDELYLKIKELLNSPQQYAAAGKICKKYTEKFHSFEKIADEYSNLFFSLMDR